MAARNTLTRVQLAESLHRKVGLSRLESGRLIESILDHVSDVLVAGDNVKITNFGTFMLRDKSARVGRNPKTGVEVTIAPRRVLTFRPSATIRSQVSKG